MLYRTFGLVILAVSLSLPCWAKKTAAPTGKPDIPAGGYAGSQSCRQCHEKFYSLWSTSRHGLAMQPYTAEFARASLLPQQQDVLIGGSAYRVDLTKGAVVETTGGEAASYPIAHVLGGKNVYYFLTPLAGGRLQTLPVAYDVQKKIWFDTAASGVRHAPGAGPDQPVHWKDPAYTFNTSCHNCHVSQLNTNYDLKTGTYETTWAEPGINCETCHGPSAEHNAVMLRTPKGKTPPDMKIILVSKFTPEQHNATCSGCHAKAMPITAGYNPGDRFFDHYGLATLEDPDYYPDGRDLGENYTYTSWLMSPCAKAGKLHCVTCHTSSGRYRFKAPEKANEACMPCHADHVQNAPAHTRHKADSPAGKCISCHMPMTSFARMNRTDHSMLPPSPAATIAFGSANACNGCHSDKDAAWADAQVRQWRTRDYQALILARGKLVEQARKRDWSELHAMLAYIADPGRDEVFAASLVKLIQSCPDQAVAQALLKAAKDPSPLVRAAVMEALQQFPSDESGRALVAAASDESRLVRVRSAATLAGYGSLNLDGPQKTAVDKAEKEYLASLLARPDQWSSHYNLGNYMLQRGEAEKAIASYDTALQLEPRSVLVMINESMALARTGKQDQAMQMLEQALALAPDNAPANFNMGLLRAERKDLAGAEANLKKALQADPQLAPAAYNLCALLAPDRLQEASTYCKMASDLRPQEPRYAYTLAYIQFKLGNESSAVATLENLVASHPLYPDSYILLGGIYRKQGRTAEAGRLYSAALANEAMPEAAKNRIAAQLMGVKQ